MQVKGGFPDQLTFEPCDSQQLYDAMSAALVDISSNAAALSSPPTASWLHHAQAQMQTLAPETLTDTSQGQQGIWIARSAARGYESALKRELEQWAAAEGGLGVVQMVLDRLVAVASSTDEVVSPAFAARGNEDLLRMMLGLRRLDMLPAILFNFSRLASMYSALNQHHEAC